MKMIAIHSIVSVGQWRHAEFHIGMINILLRIVESNVSHNLLSDFRVCTVCSNNLKNSIK